VGVKVFVFLTTPWNYILFLRESKNSNWDGAIKNCTFSEYPAVLTKSDLLANKSIYWPKRHLASKSEQTQLVRFCLASHNILLAASVSP
jgi:hypothetical protein